MAQDQTATFERHIHDQQLAKHPQACGEFTWLLSGIVLACKIIGEQVRRLGLTNQSGSAGSTNVHGEEQQSLDVYSNRVLLDCLGSRGNVGILASEENEDPIVVFENRDDGEYVVVFDPLDGSSNIDVNVSVGTIFSIYRRPESNGGSTHSEVLQPGTEQLAAGYCLYGSSTVMVYTTGDGVNGFTLDPSIGTFLLSHPNMKMPARGNIYSVNESYADSFPPYCRRYLHWLKSAEDDSLYRSRYIGSLVADFHRTLLKGGVLSLSADGLLSRGEAASDVRGESDRDAGRTSRRHCHDRRRIGVKYCSSKLTPTGAAVRGKPFRNESSSCLYSESAEGLNVEPRSCCGRLDLVRRLRI